MPGTVTVGCRLPNGLVLRVFEPTTQTYFNREGMSRDVTEYREAENSPRVVINGYSRRPGEDRLDPNGEPVSYAHGFALTYGVDADVWEAWLEQNKTSAVVKSGAVFASPKTNDVRAEAKEKIDLRTGLEKIDPTGDSRLPKNRVTDARANPNGGMTTPTMTE